MKKRYLFLDNYKGILNFLVVLGHFLFTYSLNLGANSLADIVNTFIHIFHMPAFVFCSGYLSKSENSRSKNAILKLVLYYVIFNSLMFAYRYIVDGVSGRLLTPYQTVWYLLALIGWRLLIGDIAKIKGIIPICIAITLLCGFWSDLGTNILGIRRMIAFFVYFLIGYKMNPEIIENFLDNRKRSTCILGGLAAIIFSIGLVYTIITYNKYFPISSSLTYKPYDDTHNIYTRIFYMIMAAIIIWFMFLVIPNKSIIHVYLQVFVCLKVYFFKIKLLRNTIAVSCLLFR